MKDAYIYLFDYCAEGAHHVRESVAGPLASTSFVLTPSMKHSIRHHDFGWQLYGGYSDPTSASLYYHKAIEDSFHFNVGVKKTRKLANNKTVLMLMSTVCSHLE